jgi:hypothetical protein
VRRILKFTARSIYFDSRAVPRNGPLAVRTRRNLAMQNAALLCLDFEPSGNDPHSYPIEGCDCWCRDQRRARLALCANPGMARKRRMFENRGRHYKEISNWRELCHAEISF